MRGNAPSFSFTVTHDGEHSIMLSKGYTFSWILYRFYLNARHSK
uniref:Uncharacterized protein n=1 Tax=Anguilla anguilla TaxID=7936 RepID=A0A0E9VQF4_ANGAN